MIENKEMFRARHPNDNMKCKTCIFSNGTELFENGWKKTSCIVYPDPQIKPPSVYYDGAECEYYVEMK